VVPLQGRGRCPVRYRLGMRASLGVPPVPPVPPGERGREQAEFTSSRLQPRPTADFVQHSSTGVGSRPSSRRPGNWEEATLSFCISAIWSRVRGAPGASRTTEGPRLRGPPPLPELLPIWPAAGPLVCSCPSAEAQARDDHRDALAVLDVARAATRSRSSSWIAI
jgi:hypothetical protein